MRNLTAISLAVLFSCLFVLGAPAQATTPGPQNSARVPAPPPTLQARAAVLIDAKSGQILFEKQGFVTDFPASTTKLLTALVAAERGDPDSIVVTGENAFGEEGTSCYLQLHERQRLVDLSACMLVASGNDAAIAIAEHLAGSVPAFAALMTERAKDAGAVASQFRNASGLHDPAHYTTAVDLALIARAAFANPQVRRIAALEQFPLVEPQGKVRQFINHNDLMDRFPGSIAGKTGFTEEAGHTLVHAARRGDLELIGVVLDAPNRVALFREMTALLDYGFGAFQRIDVLPSGQIVARVPVRDGAVDQLSVVPQSPVSLVVPRTDTTNQAPAVARRTEVEPTAVAPVIPGQVLGRIVLEQAGREIGVVNLVAKDGVAASVPAQVAGLFAALWPAATRFVWKATQWAGALVAGILLLALAIRSFVRRRRRARRRAMYRDDSTRVLH